MDFFISFPTIMVYYSGDSFLVDARKVVSGRVRNGSMPASPVCKNCLWMSSEYSVCHSYWIVTQNFLGNPLSPPISVLRSMSKHSHFCAVITTVGMHGHRSNLLRVETIAIPVFDGVSCSGFEDKYSLKMGC